MTNILAYGDTMFMKGEMDTMFHLTLSCDMRASQSIGIQTDTKKLPTFKAADKCIHTCTKQPAWKTILS